MCRCQHLLVAGLLWVSLVGQASVTGANDPLEGSQASPPPLPPSWHYLLQVQWVERELPQLMAEADIIVYAAVDTVLLDTLPRTAGDPPSPIWIGYWGAVIYGYYASFFRVDEWIKGQPPVGNTEERYPLLVLVNPGSFPPRVLWIGNVKHNRPAVLFLRQPERGEDVLPQRFHAFRLAGNPSPGVFSGAVWFPKDGRSESPPDIPYAEFVAYLRQYLMLLTPVERPSWGWLKRFVETERRE